MTDEELRELHRMRWRRAKKALKLVDPAGDDFATGGLGRHVQGLTVRLLVLPGDPEEDAVEFDQGLWSWLGGTFQSPFEGPPNDWGQHVLPTTAAAVRCQQISAERWSWESYLGIYRHGGLDVGLGAEGGRDIDRGRRAFWLLRIVGRTWAALHIYGEAASRFGLKGPWELSIALLKTSGAALGNFGAGWAEYGDPHANARPCPNANLFWRRELDAWPGPDGMKKLAFGIGAWIEDSFGSQNRRFLARDGKLTGQFDWQRYQ